MIFIWKQPKSFTSFNLEILPNFSFHFARGVWRKGTIRFGDNMHCSHNMFKYASLLFHNASKYIPSTHTNPIN